MAGPSGSTPNGHYPYPISDDEVDVPRDFAALATALDPNATALIIGEVRSFALAVAPARWLACDGAAYEQAALPELYAALQARFNTGGESPTQFRVPAVAGRSIVGSGAGSGLTARAIADRWGVESVALQLTEIPNHNHGGATGGATTGVDSPDHAHAVSDPGHAHNGGGRNIVGTSGAPQAANIYPAGGVSPGHSPAILTSGDAVAIGTDARGTGIALYGANARHAHSIPALGIAAQGGGGGHSNMQPSIALLVCIYAGR
jgi:microcystin-dependent protein